MRMNEKNNVINLLDYANTKKELKPFNGTSSDFQSQKPAANLVARGAAFFLDIAAIGLIKSSVDAAYYLFISEFLGVFNKSAIIMKTQQNIPLQILSYLLVFSAYFFFTNFVLEGKTLGKKVMGLTIIPESFVTVEDDQNISLNFKQCFYRVLGYNLCYLSFGTFFIFNFSSEDKRGLADYLSGTRTVTDEWLFEMQDLKESAKEVVIIDIQSLSKKVA